MVGPVLRRALCKDDILGLSSEWEPLKEVSKVMPNDLRLRIASLKNSIKECKQVLVEKNATKKKTNLLRFAHLSLRTVSNSLLHVAYKMGVKKVG